MGGGADINDEITGWEWDFSFTISKLNYQMMTCITMLLHSASGATEPILSQGIIGILPGSFLPAICGD